MTRFEEHLININEENKEKLKNILKNLYYDDPINIQFTRFFLKI